MHYLFYPRCMSFLAKLRYFSHQILNHSVKIFNTFYSKCYNVIIFIFCNLDDPLDPSQTNKLTQKISRYQPVIRRN